MDEKPPPKQHYWRIVLKRAWQFAMEDAGMKPVVIATIVLIIVTAITGLLAYLGGVSYSFFSSQLSTALSGIATCFIGVIPLVFSFIFAIMRTSPAMDQEKQDEIDRNKRIIAELREKAKPKLDLFFDHDDPHSCGEFMNGIYVLRIKVKNRGSEQLKDIVVEIKQTIPPTLGNFPLDLHFMNDRDNYLNPMQDSLVDVIQVGFTGNRYLFFYTNDPRWREPFMSLRDYEILLVASADNSPVIEKWFKFSVGILGVERPYIFAEITNDDAKA